MTGGEVGKVGNRVHVEIFEVVKRLPADGGSDGCSRSLWRGGRIIMGSSTSRTFSGRIESFLVVTCHVINFEDIAVVRRLSKVRMSGVVEWVVVCSASSNVNTEIMPVPVEIRFEFFESFFMCSLLACCY